MRKSTVTSALLCALIAGCAGSPPKPAKCIGTFQPVNAQGQVSAKAEATTLANLCTGGSNGAQG